jgi:ABC-type polysaccharide/polyol phosphate export permease
MSVLADLRSSRELLGNLTMREVRGKYKRSLLGQGWSLLNPIATLTIYSLVFGFVLKAQPAPGNPSGLEIFALWLACGLLPWNFFNNTVQGGMAALIGNANLIQKVYFPRYTLVMSSMLASMVNFCFELSVLLIAVVVFGGNPWLWIPGIVLMMALLALFGLGIALALSIANVYFRDTAQFVGIMMQIWFYATPIVYPDHLISDQQTRFEAVGNNFPLVTLYELNPLERFVECFRSLFYDNRWPDWGDLAYCCAATAVSVGLGAWIFTKFQGKIAEEL